jgi:hypothetical protein
MDARERRLGENEALFREVNERIKEIGESFSLVATHASFVCECADTACAEQLALTLEEYAAVRANPERFIVVPGHETADVEEIVERHDRYAVIEKRAGGPAQLARDTAPGGE